MIVIIIILLAFQYDINWRSSLIKYLNFTIWYIAYTYYPVHNIYMYVSKAINI